MNAAENSALATLLLVDDEENILNSLRRVLRSEPYKLLTCNSGEAALQLFAEQPIDLVISDARMPGMDGAALLAQVQQRWPNCLRILLTGYADLTTTVKAINEGQIYRYISKPWDDNELRLIIRQALAFQHSERERLRLEALTRNTNFNPPADLVKQVPDIVAQERNLYETSRSEMSAQLSIAQNQLAQRQNELREVQARREQASGSVPLVSAVSR